MNSYSTGNVTGNGDTGGLVGFSDNFGHIYKTYSTGQVLYFPSGSSGSAGGLVGLYEGMLALSDSFWDTETSGMGNSDGGIRKTTLEMQAIATFTNWDIVDISVFKATPLLMTGITNVTSHLRVDLYFILIEGVIGKNLVAQLGLN